MMKNLVSCVVVVALLAGFLAPTVLADKPIAVLSMTSHDNLQGDTEGMGELAKISDVPTWLASTLKLYDEGKGLSGIDAKRPWGIVLQLGDGLSAYAFIPVRDAEYLLWDIEEFIDETEEVGWETYRVTGTEPGKQLYAKVTGSWVYVADSREDLSDVAADPVALLGGLDKRYDSALCVETKNIPEQAGREIIDLLGDKLGGVIREHASEDALNFLGEALYASEQVIMGWKQH